MKRIFIALPLSKQLKDKIIAWQNAHKKLPVRFLKEKNLHITIIPPWYTENPDLIIQKLQEIKNKFQKISVKFTSISYGPAKYNPRLIWLSGETPKEIPKLKKELESLLKITPENRDFLLHLTIARFDPHSFHKFPVKEINEKIDWQDEINSLVLMESNLSPHGAEYEVLSMVGREGFEPPKA